jgi:hypothetical protein
VIDHNLFVASSPAVMVDNRGMTWQRAQTMDANGYLQRNLRQVPANTEVYRARYPRLAEVLSDEPGRSKHNRAVGNVFVDSRDFEFLDDAQLGITRVGNLTATWSVFKTLRATKKRYAPSDFELSANSFTAAQLALYPSRDGIAP